MLLQLGLQINYSDTTSLKPETSPITTSTKQSAQREKMSTRPLLDSGRLGSNGRVGRNLLYHIQCSPLMVQGGLLSSVSGIFSAGGIFGANTTAYDGVTLMLNAATEEERDDLTRRWRDHKIAELNFVGTLVSTLLHRFLGNELSFWLSFRAPSSLHVCPRLARGPMFSPTKGTSLGVSVSASTAASSLPSLPSSSPVSRACVCIGFLATEMA